MKCVVLCYMITIFVLVSGPVNSRGSIIMAISPTPGQRPEAEGEGAVQRDPTSLLFPFLLLFLYFLLYHPLFLACFLVLPPVFAERTTVFPFIPFASK